MLWENGIVQCLTDGTNEYMKRAAYTKKELAVYDKWKIDIMTERSAINDAKKEGFAEGLAEGEQERLKLEQRIAALERQLKEQSKR